MKIIFTGGSGRFGEVFKKKTNFKDILFPTKKELDILNLKQIQRYLLKKKPNILIHAAGLSRPMDIHEKQINLSIDNNIIGTCNLVKVCKKLKIKLVYLSTSYVYPGSKGNYKETSPLLPYNNYAWSKLGGECAVQMYKNSLILRVCMTEKPFIHKFAFKDLITNFIFHEDVVKIFPKLIRKRGIINLGGKSQTVYNFAKSENIKVKKISAKKFFGMKRKIDIGMNLGKLKKIIN